MIIWLSLIIPILLAVFVYWQYQRKVIWWELLIPFVVSIILIFLFKTLAINSLTKDYEYWGGYIKEVRYYEDWNEYIQQTCTRSYACGTDANGNTEYCTETYDCSYVQYHSEEWHAYDNNDIDISIEPELYNKLVKQFANNTFVDLGRDYHTNDGDMYKSVWDGSYKAFEFCATKHSYENKVQASRSVFNFPKVTEEDVKQYNLYNYPEMQGWQKLSAIISYKGYKKDNVLEKKLDWLNGMLGKNKQVRVWILLYKNAPRQVGLLQEALWKGGNKNEFNVAISVDNNNNIQWCYPFSWTEVQSLKVDTRTFVEEMKTLDLCKFTDFLYKDIEQKWKRKEFADFNYLTIDTPTWAIITTFIVTLVVNVVLSIWIVKNDISEEENEKRLY